MNSGPKLGAFGLVLAVALGLGALAGKVVGPIDTSEDHAEDTEHAAGESGGGHGAEATASGSEPDVPAGVLIAQDGYTLAPESTVFAAGAGAGSQPELRFRILGPDGEPVHDFVEDHERELHLIVVSSDLATYRHLHPSRSADGTWSERLPDLAPGTYRAFADFAVAGGPELTLGVDLAIAGDTAAFTVHVPAGDHGSTDGAEGHG